MASTGETWRFGRALPLLRFKDPTVRRVVGVGAAVLAWSISLALLIHISRAALTTGSGDFQWSGASMLIHGVDPYREFLQHGGDAFARQQFPNYMPLLYLLLAPLGAMSLGSAAAWWLAMNLAMFAAAAVLVARGADLRGWKFAVFVGLAMGSEPFVVAIGNGQQTGLALLAAVVAARARSSATAGGALALVITKYSFAPVAFILIAQRRWVAIAIAGVVHLVATGLFCFLVGASFVRTIFAPLQVAGHMARGAGDVMTLTRVAVPAGGPVLTYLVTLVVAALLTRAAWRVLMSRRWVDALAAAALISLLTFPHLTYDYAFLLPVAASALGVRGWRRAAVLGSVAVMGHGWLVAAWNIAPYRVPGILETVLLLLVAFAALVTRPGEPGDNSEAKTAVEPLCRPTSRRR